MTTDTLDLAKYDGIDFTPAEGVRAAYRNGLKRHEDGETGDGLEPETVAQARRFASGEATSPAWARKGNRWWGRNSRFADADPGTPAYAAAQLWGGRNWFAPIVASMDKRDSEMSANIDIVDSTIVPPSNFQFIELTEALISDRAFDGMAAGEFTDMHGRGVKITPADLAEIAANTTALLESTKSEDGVIAGLPIDEKQHDKGHASGWIVGVELVGDVLRIIPQWTELGRGLIGKKIQRYFSATVDLAKKVIYGGTLTNWPATRDNKTGRVLLRPIELSESLLRLQAENEETQPPQLIQEEKKMSELMTEDLKSAIQATVTEAVAELAKSMIQPPAPEKKELDLSAFFNVGEMDTQAKEQRKAELTAYLEQRRQQFELEWRRELAQKAHESQIAELSAKLTGGTDETPRGLRVASEELQKWLLKLEPDEAKFFADLMARTQKEGFIEFSELGHGKDLQGVRELEAPMKAELEKWVARGQSVEEFFALNADVLGDKRAYNLSAFVGKEK